MNSPALDISNMDITFFAGFDSVENPFCEHPGIASFRTRYPDVLIASSLSSQLHVYRSGSHNNVSDSTQREHPLSMVWSVLNDNEYIYGSRSDTPVR